MMSFVSFTDHTLAEKSPLILKLVISRSVVEGRTSCRLATGHHLKGAFEHSTSPLHRAYTVCKPKLLGQGPTEG